MKRRHPLRRNSGAGQSVDRANRTRGRLSRRSRSFRDHLWSAPFAGSALVAWFKGLLSFGVAGPGPGNRKLSARREALTLEPLEARQLLAAVAYEGFEDYVPGSQLASAGVGLDGGTGWTDEWSVVNAGRRDDVTVVSGGLSYSAGSVSIDGGDRAQQIQMQTAEPNAPAWFDHRPFPSQSGDVYMSLLFQTSTADGTANEDFVQFGMRDSANNPLVSVAHRRNNGVSDHDFHARAGTGGAPFAGVPTAVNTTYLLVIRASDASGDPDYDRVELWVNPTSDTNPGTADAVDNADTNISSLDEWITRIAFLEAGDTYLIDEIRVGTSYTDVFGGSLAAERTIPTEVVFEDEFDLDPGTAGATGRTGSDAAWTESVTGGGDIMSTGTSLAEFNSDEINTGDYETFSVTRTIDASYYENLWVDLAALDDANNLLESGNQDYLRVQIDTGSGFAEVVRVDGDFDGAATQGAFSSGPIALPAGTDGTTFQLRVDGRSNVEDYFLDRLTLFGTRVPATDDTFVVNEETPGVPIDVLGNDGGYADGATLLITDIDTTGTQGTVAISPAGDFVTYAAQGAFDDLAADETAIDTFTYTALDTTDLFLYYDFEAPDTTADNLASDRSGHGRDGTLSAIGTGEYSYETFSPPQLTQRGETQSLYLVEEGDANAARLTRSIPTSELNFNTQSWTYSGWYNRLDNDTHDFIFHLGSGDGFGGGNELHLYGLENSNNLAIRHYYNSSLQVNIIAPGAAAADAWHHVALVHDAAAGRMSLYVDGSFIGDDDSFGMNLSQGGNTLVGGGHDSTSFRPRRWFNGNLDDFTLFARALDVSDIASLASGAPVWDLLGEGTAAVDVTVQGADDPTVPVPPVPLQYRIDIDSTNITGSDTSGPIATADGWMSLDATQTSNGDSVGITVDGVNFSTFGVFSADGSRVRVNGGNVSPNPLTGDFIYDDGNNQAVGLTIDNLPAGIWEAQVWAWDQSAPVGNLSVRYDVNTGSGFGADTIITSTATADPDDPISTFVFVSDGTSDYRIFTRDVGGENRSRFNALQLTQINPIDEDDAVTTVPLVAGDADVNDVLTTTTFALEADADAFIQENTADTNYGNVTRDQIKFQTGTFNRKTYIRYDMSSLPFDAETQLGDATLRLNFIDSRLGNGGGGIDWDFEVFGLVDGHAGEAWVEGNGGGGNSPAGEIDWNNAPANLAGNGLTADALSLGTFTLNGKAGVVDFQSSALTQFVTGSADELVTFIIRRNTPEPNGANSYVHTIASREQITDPGPQLLLTLDAGNPVDQPADPLPAAADAFIQEGTPDENFGDDALNRVKYQTTGAWNRKTYMRFDLASLAFDPTTELGDAALQLTFLDSGAGNGGNTIDWEFGVYGLTDGHAGEAWVEGNGGTGDSPAGEIDWNNAPANAAGNGLTGDALPLGTFTLSGRTGVVEFQSVALTDFIADSTDDLVTIIVRRNTPQPDGGNSYIHTIASRENTSGAGPQLLLSRSPSDAGGQVSDNGDGSFDYTPQGNLDHLQVGTAFTDNVAYLATDNSSQVTYQEVRGRAIGEAEFYTRRTDASAGASWLVVPDDSSGVDTLSGARGGYVQALPDGSGGGGGPLNAPSIEYQIQVDTPGTYQLFARWANNNNVGGGGNSDSMFADIVELKDGPGGPVADWYELVRNSDSFGWDGGGEAEINAGGAANNPMTWQIDQPGAYTLRFSQREDGAAIDAWVLQLTSLPDPAGIGPDENPDVTYLEQGGMIVGEGELYTRRIPYGASKTWKVAPDEVVAGDNALAMSNARGGQYVQLLPDNQTGGGGINNPPAIEYQVQVNTTGTYELYVSWDIDQPTGNSDSMFVDIVELKDGLGTPIADWYEMVRGGDQNFATSRWDGGGEAEVNSAGAANNAMTWDFNNPGIYTLRFTQREDGAAVDAWVLQLQGRAAPTGDGPAVSPLVPTTITGTVPFHVIGMNDSPDAQDDAVDTTVTAPVTIDVLANDSDADIDGIGADDTLVLKPFTVLADFVDDFSLGAANGQDADFTDTDGYGWQYLWNAPADWTGTSSTDGSTGPIDSVPDYERLRWTGTQWTADGNNNNNNGEPSGYLRLVDPTSTSRHHPGAGSGQAVGVGNTHDRYAITSYTVPLDGHYRITDTSFYTISGAGNGNEIRVFTSLDTANPVLSTTIDGGPIRTAVFDADVGQLTAGDTIYVAVGPNGNRGSDNFFNFDYSVGVDWIVSDRGGLVSSDGVQLTYDPLDAFEYLPAGETGTDTFTYTIVDENPLTDGLLGHWDFDGDYNDVSGNGRTGEPRNQTALTPAGQIGGAVDFDGAGDFVEIHNFSGVTGTNVRTMSAWIKLDAGAPADQAIMSWGVNSADQKWVFRTDDGPIRLEVNGGAIVGTTPVNDGEWHHVAMVWDPADGGDITNGRLYVDGLPEAITSTTTQPVNTSANNNVMIGRDRFSTGRDFTGLMDDAAIWDRALTDSEIGAIYLHGDRGETFHGSDTATVTITAVGVNEPPDAEDDTATTDEDSTTVINVLDNDTDPDIDGTPPDDTLVVTPLTVVADFVDDFTLGQYAGQTSDFRDVDGIGWQFQWNAPSDWDGTSSSDGSDGPITSLADYEYLQWTGTQWTADGDNTNANGEPGGYLRLVNPSGTGSHLPGAGSGQGFGIGNVHDRYVITSYTVEHDGNYRVFDTSFDTLNGTGNGNEIRVFTSNDLVTPLVSVNIDGGGLRSAVFDSDVGPLAAGDTIYVAVGPRTNRGSDSFFSFDYSIGVDVIVTAEGAVATSDGTTVTYDPDGQFDYLAPGETLTDTFDYTVIDQNGFTDDLLGHWQFDTDYHDASGNWRNGEPRNQTTLVGGGQIGGAVDFDGAGDFVEINEYRGVTGTGVRTLAAWIKLDAGAPGAQAIMSWGQNSGGQKWVFRTDNGPIRLEVNGGFIIGTTPVNDGNWHHVAMTFDPADGNDITDGKLYVDGQLETFSNTNTQTINTSSANDVMIGRDRFSNPRDFTGLIDDAAIWGRALTAEEIEILHLQGLAGATFHAGDTATVTVTVTGVNDGPVAEDDTAATDEDTLIDITIDTYGDEVLLEGGVADPSVVGYWNFNDGTATDQSPNGNDGTLLGEVAVAPGKLGNALLFDGDDDGVNFGVVPAANTAAAFTASMWFNRLSDNAGTANDTNHLVNNVLIAQSSNATNDNFELGTEGDWIEIYMDTGPGAEDGIVYYNTVPDGGIGDNVWHHVAVTYDGADLTLYLDGEAKTTFGQFNGPLEGGANTPLSLAIARPTDQAWGDFHGLVDEVSVFTRALTADEILAQIQATGLLANDHDEDARYEPVAPTLNWDAALDPPANRRWVSSVNPTNARRWDFGAGVNRSPIDVTDAQYGQLTKAYHFGPGDAGATMASWEALGFGTPNPTAQDATFEIVFRPDDLTGTHILMETGGTGNGASISLVDDELVFRVQEGFNNDLPNSENDLFAEISTTLPEAGRFYQLVATIDTGSTTSGIALYLDGQLMASAIAEDAYNNNIGDPVAINDWTGGNGSGMARINGNAAGVPSVTTMNGDVALVRYYRDTVLSQEQVEINHGALAGPLLVDSHQDPSDRGAVVTVRPDGTYTYDPSAAPLLQALPEGAVVVDEFTYTLTDVHGATDSATVAVTVTGVGGIEIDMELINTDLIRLVRNTGDNTQLDIYYRDLPTPNEVLLTTVPLTADVEVTGLENADDTLIVDHSQGVIDFSHIGGATDPLIISYDGRADTDATADVNTLVVEGTTPLPPGPAALETYLTDSDTLIFDQNTGQAGDEEQIELTNVTLIEDTADWQIVHARGTSGADTFDITDVTVNSSNATQISGPGDPFVPFSFANKTSVDLLTLEGDDTINVNYSTPDNSLTQLTVDAADGNDTLNLLQTTPAGVTTNLNGGGGDDTFALGGTVQLPNGVIDGGATDEEEGDLLDLSQYTTGVIVDLFAGTVLNDQGQPIVTSLLAAEGAGDSSIENVFGTDENDELTGDDDDNVLRDGSGDDILSGRDGDDTFQLQPAGGSADYVIDTGQSTGDWIDFSQAEIADPPNEGITIDMDITAWDATGILDVNQPDGGVDQPAPQTVYDGNDVSLVRVGQAQLPPALNPFENFRGSEGVDDLEIDLMPVVREVDGGTGGGEMTFSAGDSELIDTGRSVTAEGIGSIVYSNVVLDPFNDAPRIIDNGDVGFTADSTWGRSRSEGYLGDERFAKPGDGTNTATWSFDGVTPGWYRVSATWLAGRNRADNAQFLVLDGDTPATASPTGDTGNTASIATVNQQAAPVGLHDEGVTWQELADYGGDELFFEITSHTLVVQLENSGNNFVMADAVRIERVDDQTGEIRVLEGDDRLDVISGRWLADLGTTDNESAAQQTFLIQNIGLDTLDVTVDTQYLPTEYTVTPGPFSLDPGEEATLTVSLASTMPGTYAGKLLLGAADDRDENPFEFGLTGRVLSTTPIATGPATIVDNNDEPQANTQFATQGDWKSVRRDLRYHGNDYLYNSGQGLGATVSWTVTGLTGGDAYQVAATWAQGQNRATNAPFRILAGTTQLASVPVDQSVLPNDFQDRGTMWEELAVVELPLGETSLTVELSDVANGFVIADAVRIASTDTGELAVYEEQGADLIELTDEVSVVDLGYTELLPTVVEQVTRTFRVVNEGAGDLTLTEPISVPLGFSLVHSFQDAGGAPKLLLTPGEIAWFTIAVDAAAPGEVAGELSFESDDLNEDPFEFTLAAQVGVQVIDDGDAGGFVPSGTGDDFRPYEDPLAFQGDHQFQFAGSGDSSVDWRFTGLTPGTYYRVAATWKHGPLRASDAPYSIYGGLPGGTFTPLTDVLVDQNVAPDDFNDRGARWEELAIVQLPGNVSELTVRLSNDADGFVYADGVRIEQVYLPEAEITIDGQPWESGQELAYGTVLELDNTNKVVEVTNTGVLPLQLTLPVLAATPGVLLDATAWTSTELQTGESISFTVSLNTVPMLGDDDTPQSGNVTFTTNDVDELLFELPISGRVSDHRVIGTGDADFGVVSGEFETVVRDLRAYGGTYAYQAPGQGANVVSWTFSDLVAGETYDVSATWTVGDNRATNAPFTILGGTNEDTGNVDDTVEVNQQLAPDDFGNGVKWEEVATVTLGANQTELIVELSDAANGYVIANAVRIDVPDPIPLRLDGAAAPESDAKTLATSAVQPALTAALAGWQLNGLTGAELDALSSVEVQIAELPGDVLGQAAAYGGTIWLDTNAAGHGWYVDSRPSYDTAITPHSAFRIPHSIDLVTVLAHEIGHVIGREHGDEHAVMDAALAAGVRVLPTSGVESGDVLGLSADRLPKSLAPGQVALTALTDQTSGVSDAWSAFVDFGDRPPASSSSDSAFRIPHSAFEITDSVFARLDESDTALTDRTSDEDAVSEEERSGETAEDGLDLWSVLYGLG